MASTVLIGGFHGDLYTLASNIVVDQGAEIVQLRDWLRRWLRHPAPRLQRQRHAHGLASGGTARDGAQAGGQGNNPCPPIDYASCCARRRWKVHARGLLAAWGTEIVGVPVVFRRPARRCWVDIHQAHRGYPSTGGVVHLADVLNITVDNLLLDTVAL